VADAGDTNADPDHIVVEWAIGLDAPTREMLVELSAQIACRPPDRLRLFAPTLRVSTPKQHRDGRGLVACCHEAVALSSTGHRGTTRCSGQDRKI
jgi:hypothetical protein